MHSLHRYVEGASKLIADGDKSSTSWLQKLELIASLVGQGKPISLDKVAACGIYLRWVSTVGRGWGFTPVGCQIGYMCDQNSTYGLHSLPGGGDHSRGVSDWLQYGLCWPCNQFNRVLTAKITLW